MVKPGFLATLTGQTLLRLALAGAVLLVAAASLNGYLLYRQAEDAAAQRLSAAAAERARVAERVLEYTVETHETARQAFLAKWDRYQDDATLRRFDTILARYPDGAWRNRREVGDGHVFPTGWIAKGVAVDDKLRRMLVLFWDLSSYYGPGAAIRHDNLFFMTVPQQANLGYDPYLFPNWVFDIPADFNQLDYEWGRLAYQPASPGDRSRFATPEVDDVGPGPELGPIFQVLTPIHLAGSHVATVATTMLFKDFLARAVPGASTEQRYLLFTAGERLLADTHAGDSAAPAIAKAPLKALGGDLPASLAAAAKQAGVLPQIGYSAGSDVYFAVARIDGPGWLVAATLPGAIVHEAARRVVLAALAAYGGVLLALLLLLAWILRRQVAAPLGELTRAAEQLAAGDTGVRLPSGRRDELERLADAFNNMAAKVAERDAALRHDKLEIQAALDAARLTEERWRAMTDNASDFIAIVDAAGILTYLSPPVRKVLDLAADTLLGRPLTDIVHPDDVHALAGRLHEPGGAARQFRARHRNGEWRVLEAVDSDMRGHPAVDGVVLNIRDVSETVKAESQLRQAQKLEAIGTLAGGIAHDFNNILAAILGYGEMAQKHAPAGTPLRRHIDATLAAGLRAKSLVERILAFSRSGVGERVAVPVQAVVIEALDLLAPSLPAGITLRRELSAGEAAVRGDPTQVHQVVMNLCANAVQAMKTGGVLSVALECIDSAAQRVTTRELPAGRYLRLSVRDTGSGIATDIAERIFDPFFTTREIGVGTGLGLSLVHGIVTDLGGGVDVASRPGAGSCFTVYLPCSGQAAPAAHADEPLAMGHGETVLLVDDEEALVQLGEEALAELGYEPVGFTSARAALEALQAAPTRFDVVLSDESMPGMTGSELAREIRKLRAGLPIVLMSGYVTATLAANARAEGIAEVLGKPLSSRDIARCLAAVLGHREVADG